MINQTSRDRPKSEPYPEFKNSKKISKCQSILFHIIQKVFVKVSQCRKKTERGPFEIFQHLFCRKTPKKLKGALWGFFSRKTSRNAEKMKGGPFKLLRYCMLRGKPFWFSWLDQQLQFGVFLFCRTFRRSILVTSGGLKKH